MSLRKGSGAQNRLVEQQKHSSSLGRTSTIYGLLDNSFCRMRHLGMTNEEQHCKHSELRLTTAVKEATAGTFTTEYRRCRHAQIALSPSARLRSHRAKLFGLSGCSVWCHITARVKLCSSQCRWHLLAFATFSSEKLPHISTADPSPFRLQKSSRFRRSPVPPRASAFSRHRALAAVLEVRLLERACSHQSVVAVCLASPHNQSSHALPLDWS